MCVVVEICDPHTVFNVYTENSQCFYHALDNKQNILNLICLYNLLCLFLIISIDLLSSVLLIIVIFLLLSIF